MVSDNHIIVWQDHHLHIECHFTDDPVFTLEQEQILHAIAKAFRQQNLAEERRKRYAENRKRKREERS